MPVDYLLTLLMILVLSVEPALVVLVRVYHVYVVIGALREYVLFLLQCLSNAAPAFNRRVLVLRRWLTFTVNISKQHLLGVVHALN